MMVNMNICYTCQYYNLKDCFCEKYLRGKEIAVFLCPDCKSKDDLISLNLQPTCNQLATDLISRQYAIATAISGRTIEIDGERWIRTSEVRESIKRCPSAQRTGRWVKADTHNYLFFKNDRIYKCSNCGHLLDFEGVNGGRGDANYCPKCGALMKGEDDE